MIKCFWLEPTEFVEKTLRRFRFTDRGYCPSGRSGCDASVVLGRCAKSDCPSDHGDVWPHDDPWWPKKCAYCGQQFNDGDEWQFNPHLLYRREDTGDLVTLHAAPVGAMWHARIPHWDRFKRNSDGINLVVRTPGGDWMVDGPSSNGNGWERTGQVPNVTATPSIIVGPYHGWLRDGLLVSC